jgi:hypothetical protein
MTQENLGFVVLQSFNTTWYEEVLNGVSYPDNNGTTFFATEQECIDFINNLND